MIVIVGVVIGGCVVTMVVGIIELWVLIKRKCSKKEGSKYNKITPQPKSELLAKEAGSKDQIKEHQMMDIDSTDQNILKKDWPAIDLEAFNLQNGSNESEKINDEQKRNFHVSQTQIRKNMPEVSQREGVKDFSERPRQSRGVRHDRRKAVPLSSKSQKPKN